jgi:hypothetical protein
VTESKREITKTNLRAVSGPSAPPRFIFWLIIGLFLTFVVAAVLSFFAYRGSGRVSSLVPIGTALAVFVPVLTIALAILFRRSLPHGFAAWLAAAFVILAVIGMATGIVFFRDQLPPRYQAELITQMPMLRSFLPPTPIGGAVPTVVVTQGGISAMDLLLNEPEATSTSTTSPATVTPTADDASSTPATAAGPTIVPTQAAIAATDVPPTPLPVSSSMTMNLPPSAYNGGYRHERQGWNNCGPANVSMALSFYGWNGDQNTAAAILKPDREDKNVSPSEIVRFVNEQTLVRALVRVGGSLDTIKAFVAAGFPVIVEVGGPLYEGWDWIGHYRTVVGYDDATQSMLVFDSWLGSGENGNGFPVAYQAFDTTWQPFNRVFIVVYPPTSEDQVAMLLGDLLDVNNAAEHALETARVEARANPTNPFVWFNIGSSLARLGRFEEAALAFDEATRHRPPFRMYFYQFYPFESYYNVGRYTDLQSLINSTMNSGGEYLEELHYWQGRLYEVQGQVDSARASFQRALRQNPRYVAAQDALDALG